MSTSREFGPQLELLNHVPVVVQDPVVEAVEDCTRLDQAILDIPPLPPPVDTVSPKEEVHELAFVGERVSGPTRLAPLMNLLRGHAKAVDDNAKKPERLRVARDGLGEGRIQWFQLLRTPDRDQGLVKVFG